MIKHLRYLKYLLRHKWFVLVAGLKTKAPLWRLLIHDWSKFLPGEWLPYVNFFYGAQKGPCRAHELVGCDECWGKAKETLRVAFDHAWLHHQHLNKHHWQHWVLREDSGKTKLLPIPKKYLREMVADWAGAGRGITGRWEVTTWYDKNRENIQLEPATRQEVERLLVQHFPIKEQAHASTR
jgi:hypothetical protein